MGQSSTYIWAFGDRPTAVELGIDLRERISVWGTWCVEAGTYNSTLHGSTERNACRSQSFEWSLVNHRTVFHKQ